MKVYVYFFHFATPYDVMLEYLIYNNRLLTFYIYIVDAENTIAIQMYLRHERTQRIQA